MNMIPPESIAVPERCPVHISGRHSFAVRRILPDGPGQPFLIHAERCRYCHVIRPVRALAEEPAAFVRKINESICPVISL